MAFVKAYYINHLNIALIILSCIAAHYFPYHLFVLSYAILGPAHYLTQISWLHDRKYFANSSFVLPVFSLVTLLLLFSPKLSFSAFLLSLTVVLAFMSVVPARLEWRVPAIMAGILFIYAVTVFPQAALFIAVLLPTVVHVFVFTACFMWAGAIKSHQTSAYLAFFTLLICAATFLWPTSPVVAPDLAGIRFFEPVAAYLNSLLLPYGTNPTQLFGFLGFAYTYHYLNWFSKAEIIRWHQIPCRRMLAISVLYVVFISTYAYDYKTGFMLILVLSMLHVLLEFPLNLRTFATIATAVGAKMTRQTVRKSG